MKKKIIKEKVFAQIGYSKHKPKKFKYKQFLGLEVFDKNVKKCNVFITHGGEGNIGTGLQYEKRMIVVPRRKKFDEHTNDHQLELTSAIANEKQAIIANDVSEIKKALKGIAKLKISRTKHASGIIELIEEKVSEWQI